MKLNRWKKLTTKVVKKNNYWTYFLDTFTINGEKELEYHYVSTNGSTMVIPVDDKGKIIMVEQYRYLNDKLSLEFPCGAIEEGLSSNENALKELQEETGFSSGNIKQIGYFNPYNGVTDEICYLFIANNLKKVIAIPDETEQILIHKLDKKEIDLKIKSNEIWDGMTLAAWTIYKSYLNKS